MATSKHSKESSFDSNSDDFPSLTSANATRTRARKHVFGKFSTGSRGNVRSKPNASASHSEVKTKHRFSSQTGGKACASGSSRGQRRGRGDRGRSQYQGLDEHRRSNGESRLNGRPSIENRGAQIGVGFRGRGRARKSLPKDLTLHMLYGFLRKDANDALLDFQQHRDALESLLKGRLDRKYTYTLTSLFAKISKANLTSIKIQVLTMLQGSQFMKEACLTQILQADETFNVGIDEQGSKELFLSELLTLCENAVDVIPSMVWDIPIDALEKYVSRCVMKDNTTRQQMQDTLERLIEARNQFMKESREKMESVKYRAPPDDFRSMSTNPTSADLSSEPKLFLRPIKTKGGYDDVQTYLDIQFRLFREDFISPLREGIEDLRSGPQLGKRKKPMKVYRGVRVLYRHCSNKGIIHRIMFDISKLQHVQWQHTRRLIFGSLLCLTKDEFKTVKFATVANRDLKELRTGVIDIVFLNGHEDSKEYSDKDELLMAESPSYFEAYRYVADAMKNTKNEDLPFQEYFVKCEPLSRLPAYLQRHQGFGYNMESALGMKDKKKSVFSIVDRNQWPSVDAVALNESQLEAMRYALTNELTLVQGPPGTGKTYLGLKIAHALLVNKAITEIRELSPMLIVCYTNHALDQFLKGLLDLGHRSILRVGSRCQDEDLQPYQLKNKDPRLQDSRDHSRIRRLIFDQVMEREEIAKQIDEEEQFFRDLYKCHLNGKILPVYIIEESIHPRIFRYFEIADIQSSRIGVPIFEVWLGMHPFTEDHLNHLAQVPDVTNLNNGAYVERPNEEEDEDENRVTIQGEGDTLTDRWAVDINEFGLVNERTRVDPGQKQSRRPRYFVDHQGFTYVPYKKRALVQMIKEKVSTLKPMSEGEARRIHNPFDLDQDNRWRLYLHWVENLKEKYRHTSEISTQYNTCCDRISELQMERDRMTLQGTQVVGMTTSCAARYKQCLENLQPKVVIVEEAAEVLEAHVLSSLPVSTHHLILLGDHKQLKPNPSVHKLAKKYNLELSLFERMINNGVSFKSLNVQHRMRPEIANLISHIYPDLQNHPTVKQYDNVRGVACNMFFIDHKNLEWEDTDLFSKKNLHEAEFMKALCWYFLQQGYKHSQITVLTMYTGQLLEMKKLMPKAQFEGVRLCSVDNFQGEENDIVLLSLVRSNEDGKIGFVGIENRICVALSRARMGLFVIGNFELMESESDIWHQVVQNLHETGNIGPQLRLCCANHPKREILASSAADFKNAPEGGCSHPCGFRLPCGHACAKACHPVDPLHKAYICRKKCELKPCPEGHPCNRLCHYGKECGPCEIRITKVMPICGHEQLMQCCQNPADFSCKAPCEKQLTCGHKCKLTCGETCINETCDVIVSRELSCGHKGDAKCYKEIESIFCHQPCNETLTCEHQCSGTCGKCHQGRLHIPCEYRCGRNLICSHVCEEKCTKSCPPCNEACQYRCFHSKCQNTCGKKCTPCKERCPWVCSHERCTNLCYEDCDRDRCNEPCPKLLRCHHPCIGLCGEKCPKTCRVCNKDDVEEIFFGTEDEPGARFIQLQDCRHFFEVTALDQYMEYKPSSDDSQEMSAGIRSCPKCKKPILRTLRYGNVVKEMMRDVERIKSKIAGLNSFDEAECGRKKSECLGQIERKISQLSQLVVPSRVTFVSVSKLASKVFHELVLMKDYLLEGEVSSFQQWTDWQNRAAFFQRILEIANDIEKDNLLEVSDKSTLKKQVILVVKRLKGRIQAQVLEDITLELRRIKLYLDVLNSLSACTHKDQNNYDIKALKIYHEKFKSGKRIDDAALDEIKIFVSSFRKKQGMGYITEKERVEIVNAMGLRSGHWFKCKNGHVYAIGECGGAMERGVCPECKATIGGENHRLAEGNQFAGEFDNSRYAAWSEMANLNNFDLDNLNLGV